MPVSVLLAAMVLGGAFGSASATVIEIDHDRMVIEITVDVVRSAESVVAHLSFGDEPMLTVPLLDRGGGTFGLRTELQARNYVVVFETLGPAGESSEPVSLAQLGADMRSEPAPTTVTTAPDDGLSAESRRMLWLAVAFGAGSLSLLAFWVLGGRRLESTATDPAGMVNGTNEEE